MFPKSKALNWNGHFQVLFGGIGKKWKIQVNFKVFNWSKKLTDKKCCLKNQNY